MGGHKAYGFAKVAAEKRVIMVTALSESIVASCFAQKASSLSAAIEMAIAQQGPEAKFIIMPEGSIAAPVII
jgi:nickel-dependent lactate racemase